MLFRRENGYDFFTGRGIMKPAMKRAYPKPERHKMNNDMNKLWMMLVVSLGLVAVAGCANGKTPAQSDLLHRRYVLETVDGKPFAATERTPDIAFGEGFRVFGGICNRYTGQGELSGNVLTVKQMASTKMLCAEDELNDFEYRFAQMLMAGAVMDLSGDRLTLTQGGHTLVYRFRDRVKE